LKCEERTKRLSRLTASEALLIPIAIPERGVSGEENTSEIIVTLNRINRKEATLYDIRKLLGSLFEFDFKVFKNLFARLNSAFAGSFCAFRFA